MKVIKIFTLCFYLCFSVFAQDSLKIHPVKKKHVKFKYFLSGDLFTGVRFVNNGEKNAENLNFVSTGIAPILIWKLTNKLMYEGELVVLFSGNEGFRAEESAEVAIEYSNFGYIVNDYLIIRAGTFYSSTGVFEDWHQQFITNNMTSRPLGIGRNGTEPSTDLGINFRGLIPAGPSKINYSLFLTSGEMLNMDEEEILPEKAEEKKILMYDRFNNTDFNKAISARIGYLPFSNSSLELGISGQMAKGHDENSIYENTETVFIGSDLSFLKDIDQIRGSVHLWSAFYYLNAKQHELKHAYVSDELKKYGENSFSEAWFAQFSYRPTEILNKFIRKCEIAARYSSLEFPQKNDWRTDKSQIALALNYWIHWNSVLKISYEQDIIHKTIEPARFISTMAFVF